MLLEFLKSQGAIKEVKGLIKVAVQTMAGASFGVMLEEGGSNTVLLQSRVLEISAVLF